jgi:molybdopterin-guanine dinucleotide biosynthesis protein A
MRAAVVILAGGDGRRIGGAKPLKMLAGRTLIDRALEMARRWSDDVAVSVRDPGQVGNVRQTRLLIDREANGPISGVAQALDFAVARGCDAVLTLTCDTPLLPDDLFDRLSAALGDGVQAAVPVSNDRIHPACSLWRSEVRTLLPDYLAAGRSSLKGLAAEAGAVEVEWTAASYDPFFNVNSADDLAAAEELLRSR